MESPLRRFHFHHWRKDRLAGHSIEGGIFNYEALEANQTFTGTFRGTADELEAFRAFFGDELTQRMGRSAKTEYGAVRLSLGQAVPLPDIAPDPVGKVVLTLLSPCILENEHGQAETSLATLRCHLGERLGAVDIKIPDCYARVTMVENYLSVWKMKRPAVPAWDAGSTFRLEFGGIDLKTIRAGLKLLDEEGLGERTQEGFGRIAFNLAMEEEYREIVRQPERARVPETKMPGTALVIFKAAIQERLYGLARSEALLAAKGFKALPTNSLIGRLRLILGGSQPVAFRQTVKELRKPALDQLERCNNGTKTLLETIREFDCARWIEQSATVPPELRTLAEKVEYEVSGDSEFLARIYQVYWQTFLAELRRKNCLVQKGGQRHE
jgi:CRISPR-associated protein Csx10